MTTYLTTAACAVFVTIIVGFIIPDGKLNKMINFVMRLVCIFILVSPVVKIFDIGGAAEEGAIIDYDFVCSVYSETQSSELEKLIRNNTGEDCVCEVDILYENGSFKENGVTVFTDFGDEVTKNKIRAYLESLGYININVNEKDNGNAESK